MKPIILLILSLCFLHNISASIQASKEQTSLFVDQCNISLFKSLIPSELYNIEEHTVTTSDGYILKLFRVNSKDFQKPKIQKRVVYLQHGIIDSADGWFMGGINNSIGFHFANKGFDVWVGNSRGNKYSHSHVSAMITHKQYFDFSWEQMAQYDIPSFFDYITHHTSQPKINYVGHSLGTLQLFAALSDPEISEKIHNKLDKFIAIAPVYYISNVDNVIYKFGSKIYHFINYFTDIIKLDEILPSTCSGNDTFMNILLESCSLIQHICLK